MHDLPNATGLRAVKGLKDLPRWIYSHLKTLFQPQVQGPKCCLYCSPGVTFFPSYVPCGDDNSGLNIPFLSETIKTLRVFLTSGHFDWIPKSGVVNLQTENVAMIPYCEIVDSLVTHISLTGYHQCSHASGCSFVAASDQPLRSSRVAMDLRNALHLTRHPI